MSRLYRSVVTSVVAHHRMLKVIFIVAAVAAMVLGLATGAAAEWEGTDP